MAAHIHVFGLVKERESYLIQDIQEKGRSSSQQDCVLLPRLAAPVCCQETSHSFKYKGK